MEMLLLFAALLLLAGHRCSAAASSDGGFSVEFIHRDSPRSPFHDPALSPHDRMLAAARRSFPAYGTKPATAPADNGGGIVSEVVSRSFEYLMSVKIGTPPTQMLAIADSGSDLIWVSCGRNATRAAAADDDDGGSSQFPKTVFDPSHSSTYDVVGCQDDVCQALPRATCDGSSNCQYQYTYGDGSRTVGLLSSETFTFRTAGVVKQQELVPVVRFGCSTYSPGTFRSDGLVGLGAGDLSLVSQLAKAKSFGRRFSYCLVPYSTANASSALNFGAKAVVSDPGAVSTPLVASQVAAYYTVELESVAVGGQTVATKTSRIIVDSGTTLTFLDPALMGPLESELKLQIKLPRTQSPEQLLDLCYDVSGQGQDPASWGLPDVTLQFGHGAAVTLRPVNAFTMVQEGTLCLAVVPVSEMQPTSILGNVAQQNFHVGYDLDARTVTFAPADCAKSS